MVENIRYNVPLPLFCLLIILSGCNFREVLDDYPVSGVQITLDWTGVAENLPETVRVIFYPKDAEGRKVDGYLPAAGGEMKVPPGHYAMIVYNYSTECVCIEGDECYGTIRAYTERCIGMDAGEDMIWSPDDFYVVALDDVEIAKKRSGYGDETETGTGSKQLFVCREGGWCRKYIGCCVLRQRVEWRLLSR